MKKYSILLLLIPLFLIGIKAHATEDGTLIQDHTTTVLAKVIEVTSQEVKPVPGTDVTNNYQNLKVKILEGNENGKIVTVENDFLSLRAGEEFYLIHTTNELEGRDYYSVSEPYRLPSVYFFIGLFVVCVVIFGGKQGIRGLVSLGGSFALILCVLLPGILQGYSPIVMSLGVAALIIVLGSYVTHGFNRTTSSAVVGMLLTVLLTGGLAYYAVTITRLSGFASEESVYLNLNTRGTLDFQGLLLGGILIGLLGVLYDVAIGQAVSVEELHHVGPHLSRNVIFRRALRIGREHIGALVNTLAIAYVGASLPLLLLFYSGDNTNFFTTLNREIFATEVIRIMIGSIGLVLAVPITTVVSTLMLINSKTTANKALIEKEEEAISKIEHIH